MPDNIVKRKRGRPRKATDIETKPNIEINNQSPSPTSTSDINKSEIQNDPPSFEFNSFSDLVLTESLYNCGIFDYFSKEEIENVMKNPIANYESAIRLSNFVYSSNGVVSNAIDYCTSLMCLDKVVTCRNSNISKKAKQSKQLMSSVLSKIDDKAFLRDSLFTCMVEGIAFYYLETKENNHIQSKYLSDYDVNNIIELNDIGLNASIISLPWKYTKIVGKKNGRYVLAFNLRYFDEYNGESLERKLKKYPFEIVTAYRKRKSQKNASGNDWLVLDNNHTMCQKIKAKDSEPWGRSLVIATLSDVLYKDYFTDTKRNVLDNMNSQVFYETFPENKTGNGSTLTAKQQTDQHNAVKGAIMNKRNRNGLTFISLAAGTKLDSIKVDTDIFDSKNEQNLNDQIALNMGVAASLLGAMSSGNFAAGQNNLEMITAQMYTWVCGWAKELEHVINTCVINDKSNVAEIYYFPTSFANRKSFFEMMKSLYTEAGGSLRFLVASAGVDPDIYFSVLDSEISDGLFEKYKPHMTAWTNNGSNSNNNPGRPTTDNPTENTLKGKSSNGNALPSPSDN
ncbi:hypothetical protein LJC58_03795 [Lachnospiraceae bacterium OttesenSCG-928-D06]|nr:hypothetical protein [Lachnospiraceae bacterium OttesenSCG-928-D06]